MLGGQAKMLSDSRLRRGCAAAGKVRRGRSSARSEPCIDGHSGPHHDRSECAKSRTRNELVFIGQRHVASSDQTQGCCTVVVRTLCQRLRFRESSTGQYARMPPQMPLRKRVESRAEKHFEGGCGPQEEHAAGSQTEETRAARPKRTTRNVRASSTTTTAMAAASKRQRHHGNGCSKRQRR